MENMIPITIQNGHPNLWKASDWIKVREEYRIVGNFIGCLAGLPRQNKCLGLPNMLLPEEVTLLLENKIAYITDDTHLCRSPDDELKKKCHSYIETNKQEQMECYEKKHQMQVAFMIDKIIEGKKRKMLGLNTKKRKLNSEENLNVEETAELHLDRDEILKEELRKSAVTFSPPLLVQTFTLDPWIDNSQLNTIPWSFPETPEERLKYCTFKDLWGKGYYVTEGHKFGVDYLVYPGDPVKFHAQFLIVCVGYNESFPTKDVISYGRLASISRKTYTIASQLPSGEIIYQSLHWTERN